MEGKVSTFKKFIVFENNLINPRMSIKYHMQNNGVSTESSRETENYKELKWVKVLTESAEETHQVI